MTMNEDVEVLKSAGKKIDKLVEEAVFSNDYQTKKEARELIKKVAQYLNIYPASTNKLYRAFSKNEVKGFTVPATNIRTLTYDIARLIFRLIIDKNIGVSIFELSRSEMLYTDQFPQEYAICVLAAAIKEGYRGPIFLQADHFQFESEIYQKDAVQEIISVKELINQSIKAGFYNIDIDASTLVDYQRPTLQDQQRDNYQMTALMTKHIREVEPKMITACVGGEIGHIGGKNSTVAEFECFMHGYLKELEDNSIEKLSKISLQTGTTHGGIVLPDGTIKKVKIDFEVIKSIGQLAREKYHLGGPVQHGASTLPIELFDRFPEVGTLEIHLSTEFQNIIFEHLPKDLENEIYQWLENNLKNHLRGDFSKEQFIYKTRKKALGPFKAKLWHLNQSVKERILENLEKKISLIFDKLAVFETKRLVSLYVR